MIYSLDRSWRREITLVLAGGAAFGALGLALDQVAWCLLLGALCYLGWHLYQIHRLTRWLYDNPDGRRIAASGIWGSIFSALHRQQQRNRKRKRKLGRALKRFNDSTSALPDATVVLGKAGEIEWWNPAANRLLGLRRPTDRGQRITILIRHPGFIRRLEADDWAQPLSMPSPVDESIRLTVTVVHTGKKKSLLIARDVTRLHRLEQIRRDFVANVSHELRTPLTVISGYVQSLMDSGPSAPALLQRALPQINHQGRRMQGIVEDLLLLARLELDEARSDHDTVPIMSILNSIVEDAKEMSRPGQVSVFLDADPALGITGNASELRSAFSNLAVNAVRFTGPGGQVRMRWFGDEHGAHFEVKDTGIGIEAKHIPRLTERFYRVDVARSRDSGGTGLGLAIVKHVLTRHGGELRIASVPGEGSTFTCDLPYGSYCVLSSSGAATHLSVVRGQAPPGATSARRG